MGESPLFSLWTLDEGCHYWSHPQVVLLEVLELWRMETILMGEKGT